MREETGAEITRDLEEVSGAGDYLVHELSDLTDKWKCQGKGFASVEAILRFMESYPDLDYGVPGPLVQFAESFYAQGRELEYKEKLIEFSQPRACILHSLDAQPVDQRRAQSRRKMPPGFRDGADCRGYGA